MALVIIAIAMLMRVASSRCAPVCHLGYPTHGTEVSGHDEDLIHFSLNLEFLEAEMFLWNAFGYGLDHAAPELVNGGPPPIAPQKANLDSLTRNITGEFGLQEIGHIRSIIRTVGGFRRPLVNLSAANFAMMMDEAFGHKLHVGSLHSALLGYVGANSFLIGYLSKRLVAGLLGVEDAVVREYLYERAAEVVWPYNHTVAEFTSQISELRNRLAKCGVKC
ncbi:linoleate 9S-lipoxygenase [Salvia divinorum]|uniref:Linoleate 9S-lipoxygenase n=1 Tax=Salvia divinorum TaxID=28513 RepID=A0ABD1H3I8_SALDI